MGDSKEGKRERGSLRRLEERLTKRLQERRELLRDLEGDRGDDRSAGIRRALVVICW